MLNRGKAIHKNRAPIDRRWNAERSGGIQECRFVVVANKSDLLPIGNQRTEIEVKLLHLAMRTYHGNSNNYCFWGFLRAFPFRG